MLVHSALTNVNKNDLLIKNVLVNAKIKKNED